jgi:hypothetical protein
MVLRPADMTRECGPHQQGYQRRKKSCKYAAFIDSSMKRFQKEFCRRLGKLINPSDAGCATQDDFGHFPDKLLALAEVRLFAVGFGAANGGWLRMCR